MVWSISVVKYVHSTPSMAPTQLCQGKWTNASYLLGTEPMTEPSTSFGTPHARNHEDLLALWVAFNTETMYQTHVLCPSSNLSACRDLFSSGKQLRKRPYREAWGTCKEPWGFAGSLGSLQHRSYALNSCTLSIFQSLSMPWPVLLKNPSPQRIKRPIPRKIPCFIFCCSSWIVKMTTTLWERFNLRTSVTCTTCKSLRV